MAGLALDFDGKAAFAGDVEGAVGRDGFFGFLAVKLVAAAALGDLHLLGGGGVEVVFAGEDDPQGDLLPLSSGDGVRDDFSVEVDVGDGIGSDVGKLHGREIKGRSDVGQPLKRKKPRGRASRFLW